MSRAYTYLSTGLIWFGLIFLTTCGKDSPTKPNPPEPPPTPVIPVATRIVITPASVTINAFGKTVQLTAGVFDQNNNVMNGASVTWQSSTASVVSVSTQGVVTAVKNGSAVITARSGSATSSVTVTVMQAGTAIVIEPSSATLMSLGETVQLTATVVDGNGQAVQEAVVTWQSSTASVVSVSAQGLVTAVKNGSAVITARSGNSTASIEISVMQTPTALLIEPKHIILTVLGETVQLKAVHFDQNRNSVNDVEITNWESSDPAVAIVDGVGLVTAVSNGSARITARSGDISGSVRVFVAGPGSDRAILTGIYDALDGSNWIDNTNWKSSTPLGLWHGVTTNADGYVTTLNLGNNGLEGELPPEIGHLTYLESLALDGNRLTGSIPPETGRFSTLKHLYLNFNQLTGAIPSELGNLTNLLHMCLDRNQLTGSVPQELSQLRNLKWLHLHDNFDLSGPLPESITVLRLSELLLQGTQVCAPTTEQFKEWLDEVGDNRVAMCNITDKDVLTAFYKATGGANWKNNTNWLINMHLGSWQGIETDVDGRVVGLRLSENNLSGSLPPILGRLVKLRNLELSYNEITGSVPSELGQLSNLERLVLARNTLAGEIPPELGRLGNLKSLDLSYNGLSDEIPPDLSLLTNLEHLELRSNLLVGNIPPELGGVEKLRILSLGRNQLSGTIPPELGSLTNLMTLNLLGNEGLVGSLPIDLTKLVNLLSIHLEGTRLCAPSEDVFQTWLSGLQIAGVISCETLNAEKEILVAFYEVMGGPIWRNKTNWKSDKALERWYGVKTDFRGRVVGLNLSSNLLTGEILPELGRLQNLGFLYLNNNAITGSIPTELGQLGNLKDLFLQQNRLTGLIPPELGRLSSLKNLDIGSNLLAGEIPIELGRLRNLGWLVLSHNLLTGTIPPEIGDIEKLRILGLDRNQFTGPIPSELGHLSNLSWLKLGNNKLTGSIPPELGRMERLGLLSLGENRLTGTIPPELGNLTNLWSLDLTRNESMKGPLPDTLTRLLNLRSLYLGATQLCVPADDVFRTWLSGIDDVEVANCDTVTERERLAAFYHTTDGPNWRNSTNWLSDQPLNLWFGVTIGTDGKVEELDLGGNGLSGALPGELAHFEGLKRLSLNDNPDLAGPLPRELLLLSLEVLMLDGSELCVPSDTEFEQWSQSIPVNSVESCPIPDTDREILVAFYHAAGGPNWDNNTNWFSDQPLNQWYGVSAGTDGKVLELDLANNNLVGRLQTTLGNLKFLRLLSLRNNQLTGELPFVLGELTDLFRLDLSDNQLTGSIPPELGQLSNLTYLNLSDNQLTGSIPPELGQLQNLTGMQLQDNQLTGSIPPVLSQLRTLRFFNFSRNRLTGSIPPELGQLSNLTYLYLSDNQLTGSIPSELGQLQNLTGMQLQDNQLTGSIPSELGQLSNLSQLYLSENQLTGSIPPELGQLQNLTGMQLQDNQLTGSIPSELGQLSNLSQLYLSENRLTGAIPIELGQLQNLRELRVSRGNKLCVPQNLEFQVWLYDVFRIGVDPCPAIVDLDKSSAYLTQSVQSFEYPVPLVAEEPALLRVFLVSGGVVANKPAVQATFYVEGEEVHSVIIPAEGIKIPDQIDESSLAITSNVLVPGEVVRPGLEFVVEIGDVDDQFTSPGSMERMPETGMLDVDVREMPVFDLTMVPLLWSEDPDYSVVTRTDGLSTGSDMFRLTRDLLPVREFKLTVRDPVFVSADPTYAHKLKMLSEVGVIRVMDGESGYYMGILRGGGGAASGFGSNDSWIGGVVSVSGLIGETIAHELGHNLGLGHAPCGNPGSLDLSFPYGDGNVGAWGYDILSNALVHHSTPDIMSYCDPVWISDHNFTRALNYRLFEENRRILTAASSKEGVSLLLWGGLDESGELSLDPAFAVDAPASLPREGGPYRLAGQDTSGNALFEMSFAMGEIADGEGGVFVFAIPVQQGWSGQLARITLAGPEGFVEMTRDSGRSAAILLDPSSGQVRGILRDWPSPGMSLPAARRVLPESGVDMVVSPGIPESSDW